MYVEQYIINNKSREEKAEAHEEHRHGASVGVGGRRTNL